MGQPRRDRRGRTDIVKGRLVRSGGSVLTTLSCSASGISAICFALTDLLQSGSDASVGQQGCAVTAHHSCRWSHCADAISRRTSSPICPSLISDRHRMTGGECGACRAHWPFSFPFSAPLRARLPSTIMANEKFAARPSCCKGGLLRRVEQCVRNCPFSASSAACLLLPPSLVPWRWRPR